MGFRSRCLRRTLLSVGLIILSTFLLIEIVDEKHSSHVRLPDFTNEKYSFNSMIRETSANLISQLRKRSEKKKHRRWYLSAPYRNLDYSESGNLSDLQNLWPDEDPSGDRIEKQLLFVGDSAGLEMMINDTDNLLTAEEYRQQGMKIIYLADGLSSWNAAPGKRAFLECPVKTCVLTSDAVDISTESADAVIFRNAVQGIWQSYRRSHQIWIMYLLESPFHTPQFEDLRGSVNWTATYRLDSDLVTPYEKFALYNSTVRFLPQQVNYAAQKTGPGKVAWFVSNCGTPNHRKEYVIELSKHISVDIYGRCGSKSCGKKNGKLCLDMLRTQYKFYLSFENSNCRWYITEKFWNALRAFTVPVVMGAPQSDYKRIAPYKSFIHVDEFSSPRELAEYLSYLDKNDTAYNEYFQWNGTGETINTFFFCRVCAMLHSPRPTKSYSNLQDWWRGNGSCQQF